MPSKIRQTLPVGADQGFKDGPLLQVRLLYISFVQGLFAAAPAGSYRWDQDPHATEIVVTDENPIHVATIGNRPAISFSRGPVQATTLGQDDMLSYDFATGKKKKSVVMPGVMNINVCSRNDIESERLACVIFEQLWMNRELLMRSGFFEVGRNCVIGAVSPAGSIVQDGGDEWYATTVSSPFQIYRTSQASPIGCSISEHLGVRVRSFGHVVDPKGPAYPPAGWGPYARVDEEAPGVEEHRVPHPLNPAKTVTIRSAHPFKPALRPPTIGGRTIPVASGTVKQSNPSGRQLAAAARESRKESPRWRQNFRVLVSRLFRSSARSRRP